MRNRIAVMTMISGLALALAGCGEMATNNMNANANRAANANVTVAAASPTPTPRRGLSREQYESDKESYTQQAKEAGRKIGTGINDGWLWTKTRFDLAAADDLRDSTINVDLDNDVVTLTGTVASADQKARAAAIAKSVEGVKSVKNLLKVSAPAKTPK